VTMAGRRTVRLPARPPLRILLDRHLVVARPSVADRSQISYTGDGGMS
jgi:hypothetical protein